MEAIPRSNRQILEDSLSESISSAQKRESTILDQLTGPFNNSFVLFGSGFLGRKILAGLRKNGIDRLAFADNNREKWNTTIDGLQVLSPETAAAKFAKKAAFIVTIWSPGHRFLSTKAQLARLRCARVIPFQAVIYVLL